MHSGQIYVVLLRVVDLQRPRKESCHSPLLPPPHQSLLSCLFATYQLQYLSLVSRSGCIWLCKLHKLSSILLSTDVAFSLSKMPPCVINRGYSKLQPSDNLAMCYCAPLIASDWASSLICIIRLSQLWNGFDLPPSLVTERERLSLPCFPPPSCPPLSSSLPILSWMPIISSPGSYPSITFCSHYAALHLSVPVFSLPIFFHRTSFSARLICGGISRRRRLSWF